MSDKRSLAVGSGMRAEKVKTYNFPQNRLTDHRIGKSWHNLKEIMEGDLENVFEFTIAEFATLE
jgi:peptide chain release factor 1